MGRKKSVMRRHFNRRNTRDGRGFMLKHFKDFVDIRFSALRVDAAVAGYHDDPVSPAVYPAVLGYEFHVAHVREGA